MPSATYLPSRESDLLNWATNFNNYIQAGATTYGLTLEQGAAMNTAESEFSEAYAIANNPATRSPSNVETKNQKKQAMITLIRQYVAIIQAFPGTTDTMRTDLAITIRDIEPTPVPVPTQMPKLTVQGVSGRLISLQLLDQTDEKRRPAGVRAANVFTHAGDNPPADLKQWTFQGSVTRLDPQIAVSESVAPGTEVWITALWINTKLQPGPACTPITTRTNYDGLSMNQAA